MHRCQCGEKAEYHLDFFGKPSIKVCQGCANYWKAKESRAGLPVKLTALQLFLN